MAGYVGPAIRLGEIVSAPAHSLAVQSYRPREMLSGTVNAYGYGAAMWLTDGRPEPALDRTAAPIWADLNQEWMNERLLVRSVIAAVRSATPGIGYQLANVQPFTFGRVAFAHNGFVTGFRHGAQRLMREGLGREAYESIAGSSDSGYSKPWFDTHRVLRGGSWATSPALLRPTLRNWYEPGYRKTPSGFRCAGGW